MNLHTLHSKGLVPNARVPHPLTHLRMPDRHWLVALNDRILDWVSVHVLPLIAIPMADSIKITLGVISGSWFQWWALPALQRCQIKTDLKREAKAETDHIALTHIANTVDAILAKLEKPA
jgi:hypothetical protein